MKPFSFQTRVIQLTNFAKATGIWTHDKPWHSFYSVVFKLTYNVHLLFRLIYFFFVDGLEEVVAAAILAAPEFITDAKVYFVMKNNENYRQLYAELEADIFQPRNPRQHEIAHKFYKTFDWVHYSYRSICTLSIIYFGAWAALDTKNGRKQPFPAWYFYDWTKSPYYELTIFHQILSLQMMVQTDVTIDCFSFYVLSVISLQFEFLSDSVRNSSTVEELIQCIKHHQEILRLFKRMYVLLNGIMMVQFFQNTVAICLALSQLSSISLTSLEFLAVAGFEAAMLFELFLYCWWGNEVMIKSQEVSLAAYECDWINSSPAFKQNLIYFLHRTQIPTILIASDFFKINLEALLTILRLSYSAFAVLRRFREDQ